VKLQGVGGSGGAHLDLEVNDVSEAIDQAQRLGARVVAPHPGLGGHGRSPGGQIFCLTPWQGAALRPPVVEHPDGTSSRVDQVCLDVAPAGYEVEKRFWAALDRVEAPRWCAGGVSTCSKRPRVCRSASCCQRLGQLLQTREPTSTWPCSAH